MSSDFFVTYVPDRSVAFRDVGQRHSRPGHLMRPTCFMYVVRAQSKPIFLLGFTPNRIFEDLNAPLLLQVRAFA